MVSKAAPQPWNNFSANPHAKGKSSNIPMPKTPYFQEYRLPSGEFRKDIPKYLLMPPAINKTYTEELAGNSDADLSENDMEIEDTDSTALTFDDEKSDDEDVQLESPPKRRKYEKALPQFRIDSPIKPNETTLSGNSWVIKGDELIFLIHERVQHEILDIRDYKHKYYSSFKKGEVSKISAASNWLFTAGHWASSQADSELRAPFQFGEAYVGSGRYSELDKNYKMGSKWPLDAVSIIGSGGKITIITKKIPQVKVMIKYLGKTERLYLVDEQLLSFLDEVYERQDRKKTDYSCEQIAKITLCLRDKYAFSDEEMATLQLCRLRGKSESYFLQEPKIEKNVPKEMARWFDYVNAWLFGVEASRANATFLTGIMALEFIQAGKMTYRQALAEGWYGGQLPPATLQSGPGNFKARKRKLEHTEKGYSGMSIDRQNPQWLAFTLKEAIMIKKWLSFKEIINKKLEREAQMQLIHQTIYETLERYYDPPDPHDDAMAWYNT